MTMEIAKKPTRSYEYPMTQQENSHRSMNSPPNGHHISLGSQAIKNLNLSGAGQLKSPLTMMNKSHQVKGAPTIAILRRHTMYDSLILVKRPLGANQYSLEFPTSCVNGMSNNEDNMSDITSNNNNNNQNSTQSSADTTTTLTTTTTTTTTTIITKGQSHETSNLVTLYLDGDDPMHINGLEAKGLKLDPNWVVHVPINGLFTRLKAYEKAGFIIDGQVYAYAIGLKTADQFFKSSSIREIQ